MKRASAPITVRLMHGLGNQMFQYAAGKALARKLGVAFDLDVSFFETNRLRRFDLGPFALEASTTRLRGRRWLNAWLPWALDGRRIYRQPGFGFDPGFFELRSPLVLSGYFQSHRFMAGAEEELRRDFALRDPLPPAAAALATRIRDDPHAVAVHLRRGDYQLPATAAFHGLLGRAYYQAALDVFRRQSPVNIYLFSDSPELAGEIVEGDDRVTIGSGHGGPAHVDLALMALCPRIVIANSTFSWWAAWLGERPGHQTIAPRRWFTENTMRNLSTIDLYPKGWLLL